MHAFGSTCIGHTFILSECLHLSECARMACCYSGLYFLQTDQAMMMVYIMASYSPTLTINPLYSNDIFTVVEHQAITGHSYTPP